MKKGKNRKRKTDPLQIFFDAWSVLVGCIVQLQADPKNLPLWQQFWFSTGMLHCFMVTTMPEALCELTTAAHAKLWNDLMRRWDDLERWLEEPTDQNPFEGLELPSGDRDQVQEFKWASPV